MKRAAFYSIMFAVLMPVAMQAQTATATSTTTSTTQVQAPTPQARIDAAMQAAAKAKVPATLLQSKVREGQAKHVPPQRIATAVEARLEALVDASEAMNRAKIEGASESEFAVAADAIQAGVSESALVKVYRTAPEQRRVIAVAVLTDLVRLGQDSNQALARVNGAVTSSVALANLQAEVASQLKLGGLSSTLDATSIVKIH